jgi:hypothetical protein
VSKVTQIARRGTFVSSLGTVGTGNFTLAAEIQLAHKLKRPRGGDDDDDDDGDDDDDDDDDVDDDDDDDDDNNDGAGSGGRKGGM